MFEHPISRRILRWSRLLVAVALVASSGSRAASVVVKDYEVFVDQPTGFVFVKLPSAWAFVGKIDDAATRRLPSGVRTTLLERRR